jgi:hypothetical protein
METICVLKGIATRNIFEGFIRALVVLSARQESKANFQQHHFSSAATTKKRFKTPNN